MIFLSGLISIVWFLFVVMRNWAAVFDSLKYVVVFFVRLGFCLSKNFVWYMFSIVLFVLVFKNFRIVCDVIIRDMWYFCLCFDIDFR